MTREHLAVLGLIALASALILAACIPTFQAGCTRNPDGTYSCSGTYTPPPPEAPTPERG